MGYVSYKYAYICIVFYGYKKFKRKRGIAYIYIM